MDKRDARRAAARLRNLGLVVPQSQSESRSDEARLREAQQAARSEDAYAAAASCPACERARARDQDPTALCDAHLRVAMGL
jgi:hypothetical protein